MYKVPTPVQHSQSLRLRHAINPYSAVLDENGKAFRRTRYLLPSLMSITGSILVLAISSYQFAPI